MPSPFVHSLLPAACVLTFQQVVRRENQQKWSWRQWIRFAVVSSAIANFPDIDVLPASLFPDHYSEIHRAWGHNIFSGLLGTYLGAKLLVRFVSEQFRGSRGLWISLSLVASHVLLDATAQHNLFGSNPAVPLFWPFSQRLYTLPITLFETMNFKNLSPHLLSMPFDQMGSAIFWREVIQCELMPSLFLYCVFWLLSNGYQFVVFRVGEIRANKYGVPDADPSIDVGKSF